MQLPSLKVAQFAQRWVAHGVADAAAQVSACYMQAEPHSAGSVPLPGERSTIWCPHSYLDAAADKVRSSGGQVLVGPEPMGSIGRFLVAVDPQGGTFGLYEREGDP